MGIFADIGIILIIPKGIKSMIFSFFFSKMLLGVSDKFSLRFLCLEVELLHRNKSPEKSHKKHLNPALCPHDFQKMISLWCRKNTRLHRFSTPHSPLQKQPPTLQLSPRGDNFSGKRQIKTVHHHKSQ